MKFMLLLHVLLILTCVSASIHPQSIGTPCNLTQMGNPGSCKPITECQNSQDIETRTPQFCGETQNVCCPLKTPGEISKQKCQEYSKFANEEKCNHDFSASFGVTKAGRKEFPHMAALGYANPRNFEETLWQCEGSIISDMFILTGTACMQCFDNMTVKYALIGATNLNDKNHRQMIKVVERFFHPLYAAQVGQYDVGLIKLEKPIEFSEYARPACLHPENMLNVDKATAIGWGKKGRALEIMSQDLQKITVNVINHESCKKKYSDIVRGGPDVKEDRHFCSFKSDGKDTCLESGGAPLQIEHTNDDIKCMYDIIGVTSFGKDCGAFVSVYSRVYFYLEWIEKTVWPEML